MMRKKIEGKTLSKKRRMVELVFKALFGVAVVADTYSYVPSSLGLRMVVGSGGLLSL